MSQEVNPDRNRTTSWKQATRSVPLLRAEDLLQQRSLLNRHLYQHRIIDNAEAQEEQQYPTFYTELDASNGLGRLRDIQGSISYAQSITNGAIEKGGSIRKICGNYDSMPRIVSNKISVDSTETLVGFYIEFIGINLQKKDIVIQIVRYDTGEIVEQKKFSALSNSIPSFQISFAKLMVNKIYRIEEVVGNSNPDKNLIAIIYSDKSSEFKSSIHGETIFYSRRTSTQGQQLNPPENNRESTTNKYFCLTNCKPFVLISFISIRTTVAYRQDLSIFFNNPIPPLIRNSDIAKQNENFISIWRLIEVVDDFLYASGYVSNGGFLKIVYATSVTDAGLLIDTINKTYIFTSNYNYQGYIELQIGCCDVYSGTVAWFSAKEALYYSESIQSGYFLPFNDR